MTLTVEDYIRIVRALTATLAEAVLLNNALISTLGREGVIVTERFERLMKEWTDDLDHQMEASRVANDVLQPILEPLFPPNPRGYGSDPDRT